jgi:hypothetical protein
MKAKNAQLRWPVPPAVHIACRFAHGEQQACVSLHPYNCYCSSGLFPRHITLCVDVVDVAAIATVTYP